MSAAAARCARRGADPVWREDRDFIDAVAAVENRIRCPYGEALKTHRVALAIAQSVDERPAGRDSNEPCAELADA